MDALQLLIEQRALERLKARYCFCLDTKDWDGWIALFTEDATLVVDTAPYTLGRDPKTEPMISGRQTIATHVRQDDGVVRRAQVARSCLLIRHRGVLEVVPIEQEPGPTFVDAGGPRPV